ncbi:MAG TPA: hypothetical protein VG870_10145 [Chitinophagaceae bacterium]|nr:hypothetical protein [Chitinophagaceae bacterium]
MRNQLLLDGFDGKRRQPDPEVGHLFVAIQQKLDGEISAKQQTIEHQEQAISKLMQVIEEKNGVIAQLTGRLDECQQNSEGSRQLINKLLHEIDSLKQDIDWYKRTYEKRSLLGTIKEKLVRRR